MIDYSQKKMLSTLDKSELTTGKCVGCGTDLIMRKDDTEPLCLNCFLSQNSKLEIDE